MNVDTKVLLDEIEHRIEKKFDPMFSAIDDKFKAIDDRLDAMDNRFDAMDDRFDALQTQVTKNTSSISNIQLILENEIRPAINLLAEGHIIINRKLDLLLSREEENDLTKLHVSALETRVDKLEEEVFGLTS